MFCNKHKYFFKNKKKNFELVLQQMNNHMRPTLNKNVFEKIEKSLEYCCKRVIDKRVLMGQMR